MKMPARVPAEIDEDSEIDMEMPDGGMIPRKEYLWGTDLSGKYKIPNLSKFWKTK